MTTSGITSAPPRSVARRLAALAFVAAVYFAAGKLGLRLAFANPSATAVWPPTGIALAALLIVGRSAWPAVLAGAWLINVTTAGGPVVAPGIAAGNTLEAVLGAYALERFAHGRQAFDRPADVLRYVLLAALGSTAVAATIGVTSLDLGGRVGPGQFGTVWFTWWLGDAGGDFVVAPLILLAGRSYGIPWTLGRLGEGLLALAATVLVAGIAFGGLFPGPTTNYPLAFLPMVVLIWAAVRFGRRGTSIAVAVIYATAVRGTLEGYGPFAIYPRNESLILLQVFICVASVTGMTLAAVVLERRRGEEQLRQLAVSDPLTGLANYRALSDGLEQEVQRSLRTQRPFAVLFLDVDGLKRLNDRYGHLAGSRALIRVGTALQRARRAIDTAARYGGDEFAVVLPEADVPAAEHVAARVRQLLAADTEHPPIRVSMGIAAYPQDGDTAALILAAADKALYGEKARGAGRPHTA
jgi:diguanylate cyclase (GGDEF)-like protein